MKNKVMLSFPADVTNTPVTYVLVKEFDLKVNILRASINYNMKGSLLVELEGASDNFAKAIKYLETTGVEADFVHPVINIDDEKCVHCGLCTSVCSTRALSLDNETAMLSFEQERCVGCNLCINVCTTQAIDV